MSASDVDTAPRHAFFGDGWMQRLSLTPGSHGAPADRWAWRGRVLDTPTRRLRQAAPRAFGCGPYGWSGPLGFANSANTAPLPWGDRLFATWDGGRPVEVDPVHLTVLGEVGHRDSWGPKLIDPPVLPFLSSTAHPVIDPERGCLWSATYDPVAGTLSVVRWDGTGTAVQTWPIDGARLPQSLHTVGQTRDWLVLVDCAFRADPVEILEDGERTVTNLVDEPVWLLRKDAVEATPTGHPVVPDAVLVARPEVNHYYPRWDDADGIEVLFEHTPDTDLAMHLRAGDVDATGAAVDPRLHGLYNHPMAPARVSTYVLDPVGGTVTERATATDPDRWWATQLSALDWSLQGQAAPTVHHQLFTGWRPDGVSRRSLDLYAGRVDPARLPADEIPAALVTFDRDGLTERTSHTFDPDGYATSPVFVPRPGGAPGGHDGWVVVPELRDDGFRVEVFDAADVGRGPIAGLEAPGGETVPFLVHSAWMPRAVEADLGIERLRFADEVDEARLRDLDADLAATVRAVAADA